MALTQIFNMKLVIQKVLFLVFIVLTAISAKAADGLCGYDESSDGFRQAFYMGYMGAAELDKGKDAILIAKYSGMNNQGLDSYFIEQITFDQLNSETISDIYKKGVKKNIDWYTVSWMTNLVEKIETDNDEKQTTEKLVRINLAFSNKNNAVDLLATPYGESTKIKDETKSKFFKLVQLGCSVKLLPN